MLHNDKYLSIECGRRRVSFYYEFCAPADCSLEICKLLCWRYLLLVLNETPTQQAHTICHWPLELHVVACVVVSSGQIHLHSHHNSHVKVHKYQYIIIFNTIIYTHNICTCAWTCMHVRTPSSWPSESAESPLQTTRWEFGNFPERWPSKNNIDLPSASL